jgi:hypothetical protein
MFIVKATRQNPDMECRYHFEAETKELAEAEFKRLMPAYEVLKTKEAIKKPEEVK